MTIEIDISVDAGTSVEVIDLIRLHTGAMADASPAEACHALPASALLVDGITLWVARVSGRVAGMGALKALPDAEGELKSMRVHPDFLGQGVGRALLVTILAEAQRRGYWAVSLETGDGPTFAAATGLYRDFGFEPCPPFGEYQEHPFSRFFTLRLDR